MKKRLKAIRLLKIAVFRKELIRKQECFVTGGSKRICYPFRDNTNYVYKHFSWLRLTEQESTLQNQTSLPSLPPEVDETMPILQDNPKVVPEPDKQVITKVTPQENPKKKPTKKANKEPKQKDLPEAVPRNDKYERLTEFQQQLSDLKQKGHIKPSVFLGILKGIGQEIDLQIKKTKSGHLVSQGTNRFSFHTPHKNSSGKGVDPAAVASAVEIVAQNIT